MSTSLLEAAREGYAGSASTYAAASKAAAAWAIGAWLNQTGRTTPRSVSSEARGLYAVNDMLVRVSRAKHGLTVTREA